MSSARPFLPGTTPVILPPLIVNEAFLPLIATSDASVVE